MGGYLTGLDFFRTDLFSSSYQRLWYGTHGNNNYTYYFKIVETTLFWYIQADGGPPITEVLQHQNNLLSKTYYWLIVA